jgi:hypothetical protein
MTANLSSSTSATCCIAVDERIPATDAVQTHGVRYLYARLTFTVVVPESHGRKSRGGGRGDESPQNWQWGDANTNCPPDFCHVSKFQAPDCLRYYAVKCTS